MIRYCCIVGACAGIWWGGAMPRAAGAAEGAPGSGAAGVAGAAALPVSYSKQVVPIFREHCHGCHQPGLAQGDYVMTSFARLVKGGESGDAAIQPGKADESDLVARITPRKGKADMPKEKPPLSETQIALIRRWIAEGAKDDTPKVAGPTIDAEHPPVYELPPVISALDVSPDGKLWAISGYHEVVLHDAAQALAGKPSLVARLVGLAERIQSVAFSPDGKTLLVTGGQPARVGEVQLWDVEKRSLRLSIPLTYDTLNGGRFSPSGKLISFGCSDNTIRALDAETGKQVLFNGAHNDWVLDTVFSTKSDHIISVSRDMSMKLVEVSTQRFIDNITSITPGALKGGLTTVDRHPTKDELLCGGSDGEPRIYKMVRTQARQIGDDFNLIRKLPALPGRVYTARYSRDGNRVVAGSSLDGQGYVQVTDANNSQLVAKTQEQGAGVFRVAFTADGKHILSGGFDGYLRIHEAATGKLVTKFYPVPVQPAKVSVR